MTRFFEGISLLPHLLRAFAPAAVAAPAVLLLRAAYGPEKTVAAAFAVFALYLGVTIAATALLERPLLTEALGYLTRRRPQLA